MWNLPKDGPIHEMRVVLWKAQWLWRKTTARGSGSLHIWEKKKVWKKTNWHNATMVYRSSTIVVFTLFFYFFFQLPNAVAMSVLALGWCYPKLKDCSQRRYGEKPTTLVVTFMLPPSSLHPNPYKSPSQHYSTLSCTLLIPPLATDYTSNHSMYLNWNNHVT